MVTTFRERLENTFDISQRPLLPSQEKRVEPIMRELSKEKIKLTHFITLTYPYKNISWKNTVKDNERTNRILRKFAKYYLRVLWFTERHDSGGFHRHGLIEDPFKVYDAIGTLNSREDLSRVARTVFDKTSLEMLSWNGSRVGVTSLCSASDSGCAGKLPPHSAASLLEGVSAVHARQIQVGVVLEPQKKPQGLA